MNRERVQMLRDMIAGIPEKQMNLDEFYEKNGEPCGTIACIAGWAAIYPPFVKMGLKKKNNLPAFTSNSSEFRGRYAAAEFFGVPFGTFDFKGYYERGTHKQIALKRLDALLEES